MTLFNLFRNTVLTTALFSAVVAGAAQYKFGHYFPKEDFRGVTADEFVKNAKAASSNFDIVVYPSESLVKGRDALQATSRGTVDFYSVFAGYLSGSVPLMKIFTVPFPEDSYSDVKLMKFANDPEVVKILDNKLASSNVKLLGFINSSGQTPMFFRKPITSLSDVEGRKIRGVGGYSDTAFKSLGSSLVFMSAAEQFLQLETGGVDGVITTDASYSSLGLSQVAPYATANTVLRTPYALLMNKKKWDRLSEKDKASLDKAVSETIQWSNDKFAQESARLAKSVSSESKSVYSFNENDWKLARKVRQETIDEFSKENGADGLKLVEIYKKYH